MLFSVSSLHAGSEWIVCNGVRRSRSAAPADAVSACRPGSALYDYRTYVRIGGRCWSWHCTAPNLPDATAMLGIESTAPAHGRLCFWQAVAGAFTDLR
jgi:hypothetical protein